MPGWRRKEGEYRYYAAVQADVEPLPNSYRPTHPLTRDARDEMWLINKELRLLSQQEILSRRSGHAPGKGLKREQDKLIARLRELSQTRRRSGSRFEGSDQLIAATGVKSPSDDGRAADSLPHNVRDEIQLLHKELKRLERRSGRRPSWRDLKDQLRVLRQLRKLREGS